MTTSKQSWRCLRGGAAGGAFIYECLQLAGGYYVGHVVKSSSNTCGTFAPVIGLLSWIYLAINLTLVAVEAAQLVFSRASLKIDPPTPPHPRAAVQGDGADARLRAGVFSDKPVVLIRWEHSSGSKLRA